MKILLATFSLVILALLAAPTGRAQFVPGPNPITGTVTDQSRTINSGTGTIDPGGILSVTGDHVAIRVTGSSTINNNGTIQQTENNLTGDDVGDSRGIRDNTGGLTLIINNGDATHSTALIQTASADCIQMKKPESIQTPDSNVTLNNYGTINSQNSPPADKNQAIDWNELTTGGNRLNNFSTGVITASEADAVRPGVNGVIVNLGTIKATSTPARGDGVNGKTNSGIVINNNVRFIMVPTPWGPFPRLIAGIIEGRHGITGGNTTTGVYAISITNEILATIQGDNGAGVNIDGINGSELATIINHGAIIGNGDDIGDGVAHDGDGVDVDGLVNLTNTGTITSINAFGVGATENSEGVTVGGGTIMNSGRIEGDVAANNTTAIGRGITLAGIDTGGTPGPIYANSTITNSGLIRGQTDSAIVVLGAASHFTVTINNQAGGKIEGGGNTAAAIQTAADNDTLNNEGDVIADASGRAIDLGDGNDTLNITGGTIQGDISGGSGTNTCTIDPHARNFTYSDSISNFESVEIRSGVVSFSGASTYSGTTTISGGTLIAANGTGSATGNGAVRVIAGRLGGNGRIAGDVTIGGGSGPARLAPGASEQQEARLTILGTLTFETGGTYFCTFNPFNSSADQVIANGVTIGGATLNLQGPILGHLTVGTTFTVIRNTAATQIAGAFANLSNGQIITIQGYRFRANYHGGDGNDLTLRVVL